MEPVEPAKRACSSAAKATQPPPEAVYPSDPLARACALYAMNDLLCRNGVISPEQGRLVARQIQKLCHF